MTTLPKIIVVGAGFAGVRTVSELGRRLSRRALITLINPANYFLFTPLLHEVATGSLFPENVITPLRPITRRAGAGFIQAKVKSIDLARRSVLTTAGRLAYDYLVFAPGATTNFYNTPGAEKYCLTLKDLADALDLKNRLIRSFELALSLPPAERPAALTFVVVGGGPTGVELAAEMSDFFLDAFSPYYPPAILASVKIILIQKDNHLLPQFSETLRAKCLAKLVQKKIQVRLNNSVINVTKDNLTLQTGEIIPTRTVVWTAGVKPVDLPLKPTPADHHGRLAVDQFLRLIDRPEVFVLGDGAAVKDKTGELLPMLAQVAHKSAPVVAQNITRAIAGRRLKSFNYRHRGTLISLGAWWAAGDIGPVHFSGRFAWWLWRTVYLLKMPTWSKRLQIALDWTIDLFLPRDISILP